MKAAQTVTSAIELEEVLLKNRGIKTLEDKEKFFNPRLEDYARDFELSAIKTAVKRIEKAIENKEQIFIYGDYDADGLTSTALVYLSLKKLGALVLPYIPHREKEGYGLSKTGIDGCKAQNAGLIITVDNGIVAFEQAEYIKSLGMDLIITDHHEALDKKPEAVAIVHSIKMCGAGVAWCLIRGLIGEDKASEYLDLVSIGSICDLVPLIGVNRVLVKEGLKQLNKSPRVGIKALINECKLEELTTANHISHILGPRLNAVGRLDSSMDALRLLCTQEDSKARILARKLCNSNDLKKQLTSEAIEEAKEILNLVQNDKVAWQQKKIIVLHSTNWIPGIIGLMAGRISEEYKLPTIIISKAEGISKGSARTVNGLDIVRAIRECNDILVDVGGHKKAAGFTIETEKISLFQERLENQLKDQDFSDLKNDEIEVLVNPSKINKTWVKILDKFEPFGMENQKPVFGAEDVRVDDLRAVGNGKHLKLKVEGVDAIAFSYGDYAKLLRSGSFIEITFYPEINRFNGIDSLQLKILNLTKSS